MSGAQQLCRDLGVKITTDSDFIIVYSLFDYQCSTNDKLMILSVKTTNLYLHALPAE